MRIENIPYYIVIGLIVLVIIMTIPMIVIIGRGIVEGLPLMYALAFNPDCVAGLNWTEQTEKAMGCLV